MIGNKDFKYLLLQEGDIINELDEYYNPKLDKWIVVDTDLDEGDDTFIGEEYNFADMKPIRRLNKLKFAVGDKVMCNGQEDVIEQILTNDPDGYDVQLKHNGTQQFGLLTFIP